jgi:hypothetical protein
VIDLEGMIFLVGEERSADLRAIRRDCSATSRR